MGPLAPEPILRVPRASDQNPDRGQGLAVVSKPQGFPGGLGERKGEHQGRGRATSWQRFGEVRKGRGGNGQLWEVCASTVHTGAHCAVPHSSDTGPRACLRDQGKRPAAACLVQRWQRWLLTLNPVSSALHHLPSPRVTLLPVAPTSADLTLAVTLTHDDA